jgi:predicted metalloprotease with PDZ domain
MQKSLSAGMGRNLLLGLFVAFAGAGAALAATPPGTIRLAVDASSAPRRIFHVRLDIPASPGPLTLYYPEWIPGEHGPTGPIGDLIDLKFTAGGQTLAWRRDLVEMYSFHMTVPPGASSVHVQLDYVSAAPRRGFSSGATASSRLAVLNWNQLLLYPKGWNIRELTYLPSLRLPAGWEFGTALPIEKASGEMIDFKPVTLNALVDSPVLAGQYFRVVELTPGQTPSHEIDMAADSAEDLKMTRKEIRDYKQLVAETGALFGSRHYRDYHFLLTLSDYVAHFGLEHHESSDDRVAARTLIDPELFRTEAGLLPHEFTHSWNGKYRRPFDLTTPDYQTPMKDDLLWVYEGLTEYLGMVLTGRSGLCRPEECRDDWALNAATMDRRSGRTWRPLQDTADSGPFLYNAHRQWESWRRGVDFYPEGALIWLETDTMIRRLTHDQRSIDDFCHLFHGGPGGEPALKTYTFDDIVATLDEVAPYDWRGFLHERLTSLSPHAPLGGIENGGWLLVYNDQPNLEEIAEDKARHILDLTFSVGMVIKEDGTVRDVLRGMAADAAGVAPGMTVTSVNGHSWSSDAMRAAVRDSKTSAQPVTLVIANDNSSETYQLDYHGGLRYPHLERNPNVPDVLSQILARHAAPVK